MSYASSVASRSKYVVDPSDPRAPSSEVWAELTDAERAEVVAALPSEFELGPPEGDIHRLAIEKTKDPLEGFFERTKRRVYISSNLAIYYPNERVFAPDLIAVLDVDPHPREKWVVESEKRGLDFVLEVNVGGDRKKDFTTNVERYARLGVAEYWIFDPPRLILRSYALGADSRTYEPVLGQHGRFPSRVLGLDLGIQDGVLRFFQNGAVMPETRDVLRSVERAFADVMAQHDEAIRRADEEAAAREAAEAGRQAAEAARDELAAKLAAALAEIERLKR